MKNKHMIRTLAVLLAVMLCMTAFSTVAFASDGDTAPTSEAQTEPTDSALQVARMRLPPPKHRRNRLTARISPGTISPN